MIGSSGLFRQALDLAERVAPSACPVIITGETGTGKELFAKYIHAHSRRASHHYIPLNCAAVPTDLLESELFGCVKGAFTSAYSNRDGLVHQAEKGTLFLDEIAEMPLLMQPKLLRFLQEKTYRKLGNNAEESSDVRVIAACNRNLSEEVAAGRFRQDLFYRLSVVNIKLPALRDRAGDLEELVRYFLRIHSAQARTGTEPGITTAALEKLAGYHWPGNIRELSNVIELTVLTLDGKNTVEAEDISLPEFRVVDAPANDDVSLNDLINKVSCLEQLDLPAIFEAVERSLMLAALKATYGNQAQAAKLLGYSARVVNHKVKMAGIDVKQFLPKIK
jgi:transcriptional regulator with PAS, ATPase and Fis domain